MVLKRHFAGPTEANDTTLVAMIVKERAAFAALADAVGPEKDLDAAPTLTQTTRLLDTHSRQSAVGGDRLGSEAFSTAAAARSRVLTIVC